MVMVSVLVSRHSTTSTTPLLAVASQEERQNDLHVSVEIRCVLLEGQVTRRVGLPSQINVNAVLDWYWVIVVTDLVWRERKNN